MSGYPRGLIGDLKRARESLVRDHLGGLPGSVLVARLSDWVEGVIRRLFSEARIRYPAIGSVGLVALGGFGRGELNLHSDIDLMFLYPDEVRPELEKLAQQILYPLWDLGLDVGHSTRTIEDCLEMAGQDFTVLVAMLTARPLAGAAEPALELTRQLNGLLESPQAGRDFLDRVRSVDRERRLRFGHTPYLLEPNIKEGEGGLRDIHSITWVGLGCFGTGNLSGLADRGLLTDEEVAFAGEARDFMWQVRNHLHHLAGGHDDRLTFEAQENVARFLGYRDGEGLDRVQRFMQAYYARAHDIRAMHDLFFERARAIMEPESQGRTRPVGGDYVIKGGRLHFAAAGGDIPPRLMMGVFAVCADQGLPVSHRARQQIRRRLHLVDNDFRRDDGIRGLFYKALMARHGEAEPLLAMHDSGLLTAYIPEMEGVYQLPQHDAYHLYTVDIHQIRAVGVLNDLAAGQSDDEPRAAALMAQLSRSRLLHLATLFHDLGKSEGVDHAARGARTVVSALERLKLSEEETELVRFLISHHLYLMHLASRRDIHDEKLVIQAARQVGDDERLAMLYLLSVADGKATGPNAWSGWKSALLSELYSKLNAALNRRDIEDLRSPQWAAELRERVKELVGGAVPEKDLVRRLDNMSEQYLLGTEPETIARHITMLARLTGGRKLVFEVEELPEADICQVTVVTRRRRGFFGRLAGVFTLNGLNILGGQISNTLDKMSIRVFHLEFPPDPLTMDDKWRQVESDMVRAVSGKLALAIRIGRKRSQVREPNTNLPGKPTGVVVDNEVSDFHTVIEVTAHDRLGLLYDLTQVMFELDMEIHVAKISTQVDQVVDVFYVTDREGGPIEDRERIAEITEALSAI